MNIFKAIASPLIGLGTTALMTFSTYISAEIIEKGGVVKIEGKNSTFKGLFAWLGRTLGTQGALTIGAAVGLVYIYFIYKKIRSRPTEVIYS